MVKPSTEDDLMSVDKITGTIGFLGFGNMGGAVARGAVAAGLVAPEDILVHDPALAPGVLSGLGASAAGSAEEVFRKADVVILAVKPQVFREIAPAWTELVSGLSGKIVVSVMAGIRAEKLRSVFPGFNAVRVMPNLGLSVGEGATAVASDGVAEGSLNLVEAIFNSCGTTVRVTEDQMDAVTAVSGSGPMYLFEFIGAMTEAGEKAGLAEDVAYKLAVQTAKGSLKLLETSPDTPEAWTKRVCSPGGTTLAALGVLQTEGFHDIIARAVAAAKKRSEELSA
jgi:pyrroline-5-carboxylate reductase